MPGQIVWKDARGTTRMTAVVTRDVSDHGVSVDCLGGMPIPLFRLVYFQVDREARNRPDLPAALRKSNVLSAVFRVGDVPPGDRRPERVRPAACSSSPSASPPTAPVVAEAAGNAHGLNVGQARQESERSAVGLRLTLRPADRRVRPSTHSAISLP